MVWCGVVWCGVVWCGVVWCGVVWCGVIPVVLQMLAEWASRVCEVNAPVYISPSPAGAFYVLAFRKSSSTVPWLCLLLVDSGVLVCGESTLPLVSQGEPAALSFDAARLEEMNGLASPPFPQPVKNRSLTKELLHQHVSAEHGGNGGNRLNSSAHCSETDSFDQYPLVPPQQHVITEMNGIPTNATTPSEGSVTHEHHDGSASPTHSINSQTPHLGPLCCENGNGKEIQRLLDTEQEVWRPQLCACATGHLDVVRVERDLHRAHSGVMSRGILTLEIKI